MIILQYICLIIHFIKGMINFYLIYLLKKFDPQPKFRNKYLTLMINFENNLYKIIKDIESIIDNIIR